MKRYLHHLAVAMVITALVAIGCGGGGGGTEAADTSSKAEAAAPAPAAASTGTASIHGVTTYNNGDPDTAIAMDADPVCASLHSDDVHTEQIVVDDAGNIANVFVYVKEGLGGGFSAPAESHLLDQKGCQYFPHVSGMMVGQTLVIRNDDPTLHNVHAMPTANAEFNSGQPFQGMELEHKFDKAEVMVPFKCDVHPWMSSYMAVLDHPFFGVSGGDGSFSIADLPAGDYVLEAWHETLGTQTQSVTVADGESVDVSFDFSPAG
ncbi:MAG: carboxypeptidase regulatory-like domain-containing protein [Acidobacteriota bacterium]